MVNMSLNSLGSNNKQADGKQMHKKLLTVVAMAVMLLGMNFLQFRTEGPGNILGGVSSPRGNSPTCGSGADCLLADDADNGDAFVVREGTFLIGF